MRRRSARQRMTAWTPAVVILLGMLVACNSVPAAAPTAGTTRHQPPTALATAPSSVDPPHPTGPVATPGAGCSNPPLIAGWSVGRLAEQTIVVPVQERDVSAARAEVVAGAGGIILFGTSAPVSLGAQLKALVALARGGVAPLVMADEEGGSVQRMANLVGWVPSAREMGATMTPSEIRNRAEALARRMRAAGVTMDLAPVLDLDGGSGPNQRDAVGTRSFSVNVRVAAADGLAFADGLRAGGVLPVVKHFPGLGGATGNTDSERAATQPWSTLERAGVLPFEDAVEAHAATVMISNARVPGLTDRPASVSATVITTLLRDELGYRGLVITDSLSAAAVSASGYSVPEAAVAAVQAGADMVLFTATASALPSLTARVVSALVTAAAEGRLPRSRLVDAVAHILAAKGVDLCSGRVTG